MMKTYIKEILQKRNSLSETDYKTFSEKICRNIETLDAFTQAKNLLVFYPYKNEANIIPVIKKALKARKNVYFPLVTSETTMEFILVKDLETLKDGYKGIKEPIGRSVFDAFENTEKTCMLAPGSSFDYKGNRTGYGKGYYDRYLEDCFEKICKVGICFSLQLKDEIPDTKPTDIPMDYVITECGIIRSDK